MEGIKLVECKLKQWRCSIKGSLKFLNSLCFGLQDKFMFHRGQGNKITNPIITFDSIKMMYHPTIRQGLAVSLLPDKDMFWHSVMLSSRMSRAINPNITMAIKRPTTFPVRMFITYRHFPRLVNPILLRCTSTASSSSITNYYSTIYAIIYRISLAFRIPRFFSGAASALSSIARGRFPTNNTYPHNILIISYGLI